MGQNSCAMYVRVKRFRSKDGWVRECLYVVKGVRGDGKPGQKVVAYLGQLDELYIPLLKAAAL